MDKTDSITPTTKRKRRSSVRKVQSMEQDSTMFVAVLSGQAMQVCMKLLIDM